MESISLYRRWRSQTFSEIVGQGHITRTLRNVIKNRRLLAHAYLFCGPRGTGKTSMARIFAKALNCTGDADELPCNTCPSCIKITEGSSMDVMEIDAASHTSVEMVREYIIDKVNFAPMEGRYKIYIIDEAHKLSNSSFNALLKTLEEPPRHVVFILATTHPHDLLPTILSRCQRFDFRRITQDDIVAHLRDICHAEGYVITENSLNLIASSSFGSLRDALVILEQAFSFSDGEITPAHIMSLLGISDKDALFSFSQLVAEEKIAEILVFINDIIKGGKDIFQFVKDLTEHYRSILVSKYTQTPALILEVTNENALEYKKIADLYDTPDILRIVKIIADLLTGMKESFCERALLEAAAVRMASRSSDVSISNLKRRLDAFENKLKDFEALSFSSCDPRNIKTPPQSTLTKDDAEIAQDSPSFSGAAVSAVWPKILQAVKASKISLHAVLVDTKPFFKGQDEVELGIKEGFKFHKSQVDANIDYLSDIISRIVCRKIKLSSFFIAKDGFMETSSAGAGDDHESFVNEVKNIFS